MTTEAVNTQNIDNSGRMIGMLSIAAAPGALLISPTMFALVGFFIALMGLTIAAPHNRFLSIIGMVATGACGAAGYYFNTPII